MQPINIFIADDKREICDSIEENILIELSKFEDMDLNAINIQKSFTDHAYKHGCALIKSGFVPDICIFDLVFNGDTGMDLYEYIKNNLNGKPVFLCIYTGSEKTFSKRKDAEVVASSAAGYVTIISKPDISKVLSWVGNIMKTVYKFTPEFEDEDPFDLL